MTGSDDGTDRDFALPADTELDWVAYMEEVEGFLKACPSFLLLGRLT